MLDTQVNGIAALAGTFLFLTSVTMVLRFLARSKVKNSIAIDDYLAVAAWIGFVGLSALALYGVTHTFIGYHEPDDKLLVNKTHPMLEQVYTGINALSAWTFGTTKLSALFFLRRIFCPINGGAFHFITLFYIFIVASWTVIFVILPFNLCPGHSFSWAILPGHSAECTLVYPYTEAATISDFTLDVLILLLPLPKIWMLKTNTYRKLAISGVFLFALVGLAASLTRMVIVLHLVLNGRAVNDEDAYQSNTQSAYYAMLEGGFTIVAVNMPSLWYFIAGINPERVLRSVRSLVSLRSGGGASQNSKTSAHDESSVDHNRDQNWVNGLSMDSKRSHYNMNNPFVESHDLQDMEPIPPPDTYHVLGQQGYRSSEELV